MAKGQDQKSGRNLISDEKDYLGKILKILSDALQKEEGFHTEIHVTMWNHSLSRRNVLNDGCFKAANVMRNMIAHWEHCDLIGYWQGTDIVSTDEETTKLLFGGTGLLTQSFIRKPIYHAYSFLNKLLPYCLFQNSHLILTTDRKGKYILTCHNYKHYNYRYYLVKEAEIKISEQEEFFEDLETLHILLQLQHVEDGNYLIKKRYVNKKTGNIQNSWMELGQYDNISYQEIHYLNAQSEPGLQLIQNRSDNGFLKIEINLEPQEIVLMEIRKL